MDRVVVLQAMHDTSLQLLPIWGVMIAEASTVEGEGIAIGMAAPSEGEHTAIFG